MNQLIKEFKDFAVKGNMIDMAVGIIIGGAFGKIITSLVNDVIMPPIGLLVGGVNFTDLKWDMKDAVVDTVGVVTPAVTLNYGNFLQVLFDFLIVAFTIFMFVRLISKAKQRMEAPAKPAAPEATAPPTKEETLLTEIRDLLKQSKK
ncbi:MAG: Large-conductance mechanosensitive channel [Bacteroidetes bacterium ADurb.Bin302]|nr:MAG: Large-conductance mechanosensitive channel [Bacteroidetes bacterium ADurb.Bin302]